MFVCMFVPRVFYYYQYEWYKTSVNCCAHTRKVSEVLFFVIFILSLKAGTASKIIIVSVQNFVIN